MLVTAGVEILAFACQAHQVSMIGKLRADFDQWAALFLAAGRDRRRDATEVSWPRQKSCPAILLINASPRTSTRAELFISIGMRRKCWEN